MSAPFRLTGLIAAPHTPLGAGDELNLPVVARQAELLLESGVHGAFVGGSTGEGHSLTTEERTMLAEQWVRAAGGRLKVIVHVGHNSRPEAVRLAAHAQRAGADAIAAVAPSYYKPATVADLLDFFEPIAAAAPRLPFYFYDIPVMTGVSLPTAEFLDRAADRIPTLTGVKYTNGDLIGLQECLALRGGQYDLVFGYDEMLLAALALGVKGAIGSTYNFAAPLYQGILRAFESGDLAAARRAQLRSVALVRVLNHFGGMRAGKALMGMLGVPCGPVRSPIRPLGAEELLALYEALCPLDVFVRPLRRPAAS
jgi:N-acetylneuraminate lyase